MIDRRSAIDNSFIKCTWEGGMCDEWKGPDANTGWVFEMIGEKMDYEWEVVRGPQHRLVLNIARLHTLRHSTVQLIWNVIKYFHGAENRSHKKIRLWSIFICIGTWIRRWRFLCDSKSISWSFLQWGVSEHPRWSLKHRDRIVEIPNESTKSCLGFWYHNMGNSFGTLKVFLNSKHKSGAQVGFRWFASVTSWLHGHLIGWKWKHCQEALLNTGVRNLNDVPFQHSKGTSRIFLTPCLDLVTGSANRKCQPEVVICESRKISLIGGFIKPT